MGLQHKPGLYWMYLACIGVNSRFEQDTSIVGMYKIFKLMVLVPAAHKEPRFVAGCTLIECTLLRRNRMQFPKKGQSAYIHP
jgi:hypothetical protein